MINPNTCLINDSKLNSQSKNSLNQGIDSVSKFEIKNI